MEGSRTPGELTRRRFLEGLVAGVGAAAASFGATFGLAHWLGPTTSSARPLRNQLDYGEVPARIESPILRVAQWYDYWPGSFILNFRKYIRDRYAVNVDVVQDIYTSNEQLFTWITQGDQKFDVIFPTQYMVERLEREGRIYNLNRDWLPNLVYLFPWVLDPVENPWAYRNGDLLTVPYQWGTTGIGFRTDQGWTRADIEADGWDIFWMDTYKGVDIRRKKMFLDDMRETIGAAYKYLGWKEQEDLGLVPTNIPWNPDPPYNGRYQWSVNERDEGRLNAARDALLAAKPGLLSFNTQNQGPFLVNGVVLVAHAWSGDIVYAIRPGTSTPSPVDFWWPTQGATRWVDSAVVPTTSQNLFLAHEFMNFFLDPVQGARITDWNLLATPNAESFNLLTVWGTGYDPREDPRIYADLAIGYAGPSILERLEYVRDIGPEWTQKYVQAWSQVKSG